MRLCKRIVLIALATLSLCGCKRTVEEQPELPDATAALEARLDRLEKSVAMLGKQLEATHTPAAAPAADSVPAAAPDATALLRQIEELIDARTEAIIAARVGTMVDVAVTEKVGTPEDIEAVFEDVVQEELAAAEQRREDTRREEREKRRDEWEARRKQRDLERLAKLTETLSLNDWQENGVVEVEEKSRAQLRAAMTEMRESGDFSMSAFRETAKGIQTTNNVAVSAYLSATQMEKYKEQQEEEFSFFNMWRGRRGRGR